MFKQSKVLRSILAALILFIPLYPKFPLSTVTHTYVAIRLDDIVVAAAILAWLVYQIKHKFPVLKLEVTRLFIAYLATITVVNIISYLTYQTDPLNILLLHLFRRFEYMSLFFIAYSSLYDQKDLKYPFVFLVLALIGTSVYGFGQRFWQFPVISTMNEEFSKGQLLTMSVWTRISSTFAGHYDYAAFLSLALIIVGSVIAQTKKIHYKLILTIVFVAAFIQLTYTASRVSIFAFWGGISLSLFLLRKYLWIIPVSLMVIFSIVQSPELSQRLIATIPSLKNQFKPSGSTTVLPTVTPIPPTPTIKNISPTPKTGRPLSPTPTVFRHQSEEVFPPPDVDAGVARSGEIRFNVEWPRAINAFVKNPLIGTGLGSLTLATDNDYLRNLGESGLLGFITFSTILFWFFWQTKNFLFVKNKSLPQITAIILFCCLLTHLVNALFIDVFEASKTAYTFWIIMGIYYFALKLIQNGQK